MIPRVERKAILHSEEIIHASESKLPVARFKPLPYPETVVQFKSEKEVEGKFWNLSDSDKYAALF